MRGTLWALVLLILGPGAGRAQAPDSIAGGAIIRVFHESLRPLPGGSRQTGWWERGVLVRADSAGLTWRPGGSSVAQVTPWSQVGHVEVSRGKRSHAGTGAAVGAVMGAIPGALIGTAFVAAMCECSPSVPRAFAGGLIVGLIFVPPGALVGAIVGELVRTERWEPVPPTALRVTVLPEPGGLGIGLALPF